MCLWISSYQPYSTSQQPVRINNKFVIIWPWLKWAKFCITVFWELHSHLYKIISAQRKSNIFIFWPNSPSLGEFCELEWCAVERRRLNIERRQFCVRSFLSRPLSQHYLELSFLNNDISSSVNRPLTYFYSWPQPPHPPKNKEHDIPIH